MQSIPELRQEGGPVTRVTFLADYRYETEGRGKGPLFKKGAVYDFPDDLAQRFLRRNVAERVDKKTPITDKYLVAAAPAPSAFPTAATARPAPCASPPNTTSPAPTARK